MRQTKFSFEVPYQHLMDFHEDQDFIFTLSMSFDDPRYTEYVTFVRDVGLKPIWIDNSFNEKFIAEPAGKLVDLYNQFRAVKIIAPDDITWGTEQILYSYNQLLEMLPHKHEQSAICVVSSYQMYLEMYDFGIRQFAVSYWTRKKFSTSELREMDVHFLGLLDMVELQHVRPRSCDTSMPIKIALLGWDLQQWCSHGYPHINTKEMGMEGSDFFNMSLTNEQLELAKRNIRDLRRALNG